VSEIGTISDLTTPEAVGLELAIGAAAGEVASRASTPPQAPPALAPPTAVAGSTANGTGNGNGTARATGPLSLHPKSSTFDYLYEFSETHKVLEEFFKCPFTARISLRQALSGVNIQVPTLQGEPLDLSTAGEVIRWDSTRRIPGQGLPHQVNGSCRGDLVVDFIIEFPETVSETVISLLK